MPAERGRLMCFNVLKMSNKAQNQSPTTAQDQAQKAGEMTQSPQSAGVILYAEKGKDKKRVPIIRGADLAMIVRGLYTGLNRQQQSGRRLYNLSGSNALYLQFFDKTPFVGMRKIVPNGFSPLALYDALLELEKMAGGKLPDFPELEAQFRTLREEKEKYIASAHHKPVKSEAAQG